RGAGWGASRERSHGAADSTAHALTAPDAIPVRGRISTRRGAPHPPHGALAAAPVYRGRGASRFLPRTAGGGEHAPAVQVGAVPPGSGGGGGKIKKKLAHPQAVDFCDVFLRVLRTEDVREMMDAVAYLRRTYAQSDVQTYLDRWLSLGKRWMACYTR